MPENGTGTLLRPRYFDRQQLLANDLNLGLQYVQERLRRHNRYLHGWGVVCGAVVQQADPGADPWLMQVGEGFAVTPRGDEVYIPPGVVFDIEASVLACLGTEEECPDVHLAQAMINPPGRDIRSEYNDEWVEVGVQDTRSLAGYVVEHTLNIDTPQERMGVYYRFTESTVFEGGSLIRIHSGAQANHSNPPSDRINRYVADPGELGNWRLNNVRDRLRILDPAGNVVDQQIFVAGSNLPVGAGTVYLAVCADEDPCYPQAALPQNCTPAGGTFEFSRVCEGYRLRVLCDLPPTHTQPELSCNQLEAIVCDGAIPPCPPAGTAPDDDCVVLATIGINRVPISIDNTADRRSLLSEPLLQAYLRCQCVRPAPTPAPTPQPTTGPTIFPTFIEPTVFPTFIEPTFIPTFNPTFIEPTVFPTFIEPTFIPTFNPTFIEPTVFPTFIEPTVFPTVLPTFIEPTVFPTFIEPTFIPTFNPTFIVGPVVPIDLNGLDTDLGGTLPVTDIPNIGRVRGGLLADAGINNVLDFATQSAAELAEIMNVSEVQVAEMQLEARALMARGGNG